VDWFTSPTRLNCGVEFAKICIARFSLEDKQPSIGRADIFKDRLADLFFKGILIDAP